MRRISSLPKVRPEANDGQAPGVGVADFPGRAVVHLGAVQECDHMRGRVDGIPAALEYVLLGLGSEADKVGVVKEVARPSGGDAGDQAQAVSKGREVGPFTVGE